MKTKVINHSILLMCSTINHSKNFTGITFGQLLVFETFPVATAAVPDDKIDIVRRDIPATDVAVIITFSVKWANTMMRHDSLLCKDRRVCKVHGKPEGKVVTVPPTQAHTRGVTRNLVKATTIPIVGIIYFIK